MGQISDNRNGLSISCACGIRSGQHHEAHPDDKGNIYVHESRGLVICGNGKVKVDDSPCDKYWDTNYGPNHMLFTAVPERIFKALIKAHISGSIAYVGDKASMQCANCGESIEEGDISIDISTGKMYCQGIFPGISCEDERFFETGQVATCLETSFAEIRKYCGLVKRVMDKN